MSLNPESPIQQTHRAPSISIAFDTTAQRPRIEERGISDAPTIHGGNGKESTGDGSTDGEENENEAQEYWETPLPKSKSGDPSSDFARVLLIDVNKEEDEYTTTSMEFFGKEDVYTAFQLEREEKTILRVLHVQNLNSTSQKGLRTLLAKYDIEVEQPSGQGRDQGKSFSKFVALNKPRRLAGKPLYHARSWPSKTDDERGIKRLTFGFDYMRLVPVEDSYNGDGRTSQLMAYDEDENPAPAFNIYPQRCSVFVQKKIPPRGPNDGPQKAVFPSTRDLSKYDNGSTIIIFDNAHHGSCDHTLIPMRKKQEARWRRITLEYGPQFAQLDEDKAVMACMKSILNDVFFKILNGWDQILDQSWEHVNILEDQIYEQPADETRAPELWTSSALWLKYDKLLYFHQECFEDAYNSLQRSLFKGHPSYLPFPGIEKNFKRLNNTLQDDLVKATQNLSDLMYKSVEIRDSHHSLRLGASMWRLSWVTFVFLPLTFICGFFGMNVDIFAGEGDNLPGVKWYFIVAVPFMLLVLISWYALKEYFNRHQRRANERSAYTTLFSRLQVETPTLWTRTGPRSDINLSSIFARIKWRLMNHWTRDAAVLAQTTMGPNRSTTSSWIDPEAQETEYKQIGWWARQKQELIKRWTKEIVREVRLEDGSNEGLLDGEDSNSGGGGTSRGVSYFGGGKLRLVHANTVERKEEDGVRMFRLTTMQKEREGNNGFGAQAEFGLKRGPTIRTHEVSRSAPMGKTVVMTRTFDAEGEVVAESSRGGSSSLGGKMEKNE